MQNCKMKFFVFAAAVITLSQASVFVNAPKGRGCRYPNWKCDCDLVYRCDGTSGFPNDFSDTGDAGYIKNLAPRDYPLRIPGKRWRRDIWSQEEFCKRECYNRMNAFLCLDDGNPSPYSYIALCLKLLSLGPFAQDGTPEPCCEVYLQWGLNWCPDKWYRLVTTTRCLSRNLHPTFTSVPPSGAFSAVLTAGSGCEVPSNDFDWCDSAPACTGS